MMDDLAQLQSRVEAARDRLGGVEADQKKYGLRLDDLVRIVEGALSRQSEELKAARIRSASLQTELDDARNALSRTEVDLAARETDLTRLQIQNEQLRTMVMTLLELVEGRSATPMREAMVRLERGVRHLISEASGTVPPAEDRRAPAPQQRASDTAESQPSRPVLVPSRTVQGRIPLSQPAPDLQPAEGNDALIELTAFGRGNSTEIVKEPPERSEPAGITVTQIRRIGEGNASPARSDV
jgi:hypothetical protein